MRSAFLFVALSACAGSAPSPSAPSPASSSASPARAPSEPAKVGDRMDPIAGPIAIPVKGAKLTMVNYFATWCESSKRWMPHVEEMKKKYARDGLAVIAVANYDESTQSSLEEFVTRSGGTFPVSADKDRRILNALPPRGWGQAIVVVDSEGVVRLVHRGSRPGAFEEVDAELGRLLGR